MYARELNEQKYEILIIKIISLVFITQSYFSVPKDVILKSTHYLIMKINNKTELKSIVINHISDIDYQDFKKIYRKCRKEPFNYFWQ